MLSDSKEIQNIFNIENLSLGESCIPVFVTFLAYLAGEIINIKSRRGLYLKSAFITSLIGVIFNGIQIIGVGLGWKSFHMHNMICYIVLAILFFILMFIYMRRLFVIIGNSNKERGIDRKF